MTERKCAYCDQDSHTFLHGASSCIPVCNRCAQFFLFGVTAGSVSGENNIDISRCIDTLLRQMVDEGIIAAESVTRMGVME